MPPPMAGLSPLAMQSQQPLKTTKAYVGTLSYMSPERLEGLAYSYSSDIWALGMIIYEMVIGDSPYPDTDKPIIQAETMNQLPAPNFDTLDSVSLALKDFIKCMCQKESDKRWTADRLLQHQFIVQYNNSYEFIENQTI